MPLQVMHYAQIANTNSLSLEIQGKPIGRILPASLTLWLVGIYIGLYVIRPWELLFPALAQFSFERIYALAMIQVVLMSEGIRLKLNVHSVGVLLVGSACVTSAIVGYNLDRSWQQIYHYLPILISFVLIATVAHTLYDLVFIVVCHVGFMGLYLAKSLWEFHIHGAHAYAMGVVRLGGIETTYGSPNAVAASTVIVFPYLHFLWVCRSQITCNWPGHWPRLFAIGLTGTAAMSLWAVVLTNSRTGFVAAIVYGLLSTTQNWSRVIPRMILLLLVAAVCWQFIPESNRNRFRTLWDPEAGPANAQTSAESREEGFWVGMEIFSRNPIFGVGPGNFTSYRKAHIDGGSLEAHNLPGQLLAELGLVGVVTFPWIGISIVLSWKRVRNTLRHDSTPDAQVLKALARANLFSLVILCIISLSGHTLYRPNWIWICCFSMLAVNLASLSQLVMSQRSESEYSAWTA